MKYMMFVCVEPGGSSEADWAAAPDIDEWLNEVADVRVAGHELDKTSTAKTVRVRQGEVLVTDGPYTESKEWIVGFDILDCPDIETAIRLAARHPVAYGGRIEVRPFLPIEGE
jgi:hypothetical protein